MIRFFLMIVLALVMMAMIIAGAVSGNEAVIQWAIGIISPLGTLIMLSWLPAFVREDIDENNRTDKGMRAISGIWSLIVIQDIILVMKVFHRLELSWWYMPLPTILAVTVITLRVIWMNPPEKGRFYRIRRKVRPG